jgi:Skp family chaperone for outer membrane proteins
MMKTALLIVSLSLVATSALAQQQPAAPARGRAAAPPAAAPAGPPNLPFPAGAKVAFVNVQYIAANSADGKVANGRVNTLVQKKQAEIAANKNPQDAQRLQQEAQNEVQKLQADLQAEFQKKLMPILTLLAQEKHLSLLLSAADAGLIWAEPGLDLTAEALKRLDASTAKK